MHRPEARAADVEQAVAADPGLAVRLLKMVNSAAMGLPRRVDSVRTAVSLLGARRIQALAVLLAAQARSEAAPVLATIALTRARMCEALARRDGVDEPAVHFTVGLLSVLDAMLDMPMSQVVGNLPLSELVASALIDPFGPSPTASSLRAVLLFEQAKWDELFELGYDPRLLSQLCADASGPEPDCMKMAA